MKVGTARIIDQKLEGRVWAQEGQEGVVIDEEWFRLRGLRGNDFLPNKGCEPEVIKMV